MIRLNFIPIPLQDESVVSLLFRCAATNGYKCLKHFNQAFGLELTDHISHLWQGSPTHRLLTRQIDITSEDKKLIDRTFHTLTREGSRNIINIHGTLFPASILRQDLALCPSCVRAGYLNKMHTYRWSDSCPVHSEHFIHHCPQCNNPVLWLTLEDFHCPCGFDLRLAPSILVENSSSKIINQAMSEKNTDFFSLLMPCMNALRYLSTPDNRSLLQDICVNIANGKKTAFFDEMIKLHRKFPTLHRRALLAPFILSQNRTLSQFGMEFFFVTQQSKPAEHNVDCCCSDLLFTETELAFVFATHQKVMQLKSEHRCIAAAKLPKKKILYKCPNMCKSLMDHDAITWDHENRFTSASPEFKLLNAIEAAEILHTVPSRIRSLERAGLLKAVVLHKVEGVFTSLLSIKEFNDKYILKSEIRSRTTLNSGIINYLLANSNPIKIGGASHAKSIRVYLRDSLPKELLNALNDTVIRIIQQPLGTDNLLKYSEAAKKLRVNITDITPMILLGLLKISHSKNSHGVAGRDYCNGASVEEAISWRNNHLSLDEVAKEVKCSRHLIQSRFIKSGFAEFIELNPNKFVSIETSKKITNHYNKFTTLHYFAREIGCTIKTIFNLIENNKIHALTSSDPNYINGQLIINRAQAKKAIASYFSEQPRTYRI